MCDRVLTCIESKRGIVNVNATRSRSRAKILHIPSNMSNVTQPHITVQNGDDVPRASRDS